MYILRHTKKWVRVLFQRRVAIFLFLFSPITNLEKILNHPTAVISDSSHEWGVAIPISNLHIYSEHIATSLFCQVRTITNWQKMHCGSSNRVGNIEIRVEGSPTLFGSEPREKYFFHFFYFFPIFPIFSYFFPFFPIFSNFSIFSQIFQIFPIFPNFS